MRKVFGLGGTLLLVLFLTLISGFQPLFWLLYVVAIGSLVGYLWAWLQSRGLEFHVEEPSTPPYVGETVQLQVGAKEKLGLPRIGLRARLVSDLVTTSENAFSLAPHGTNTWTIDGRFHQRGMNSIGSLAIMSSDPTGLLSIEYRRGQSQSILVFPATIQLSHAVVLGRGAGGSAGDRGQLSSSSSEVSMVRPYVPGDTLSRIHWNTTARLDQLMTKEFEGTGINEVWIFMDFQGSVQAGSDEHSTEEYGVTIAASLAKRLVDDGQAVGLVVQGDEIHRVSPNNQPTQLSSIMRSLALVRAKGRTPLSTLIEREAADLSGGTAIIVIGPWPRHNIDSISQFLTRRGILLVSILLDAHSFENPSSIAAGSRADIGTRQSAFVVRMGDDLTTSLHQALDILASY